MRPGSNLRPVAQAAFRRVDSAVASWSRCPAAQAVGPEALRAVTGAVGAALRATFEGEARMLEGPVEGGLRPNHCALLLELGATGQCVVVELEQDLVGAAMARLAGCAPAAVGPGPLAPVERAALAWVALRALRAVRDHKLVEAAWALRLADVAATPEAAAPWLVREARWTAVDLDLRLDQARGGGRLLIPSPALRRLRAEVSANAAPSPLSAALRACRIGAPVLVGRTRLETGEVSALAIGDVVLLEGVARAEQGVCGEARLQLDGCLLRGPLTGPRLTVSAIHDATREDVMTLADRAVPPMPVAIEVQLARVLIPLGELADLKEGSILELDLTAADPVLLRIGERAFARAELVDVDGMLGARILSLIP